MPNSPVVHLIDDDDAVRESLAFLLEAVGFSVRTYESALHFLQHFPHAQDGCVITDVRMPEMTGIDLVKQLNELGARIPVIVITGHGDVPLAVEAMKAGVVDFIEKPFEDEAIITAVRSALQRCGGDDGANSERTAILERLKILSPRERQVLQGLIAGKPNKVVAYELEISPRTVEVYRANLMAKMQAASLSELVRMALMADLRP